MGFFKRLLGICQTQPPADPHSWRYAGAKIELDLTRAPELSQPGGAIRLEGRGLPQRVLIVRGQDEKLHAFRNKCPHVGRRLDPLPGQPQIRCCSLGKSTFDYQGRLISGSAKSDLPSLPVEMTDQKLTVILKKDL